MQITNNYPIHWVLERDVFSEACFGRMEAFFLEESIPYHILRVIPFSHEIEGKLPLIAPDKKVVCYGSYGIQKIALEQGWKPGIWTSPDFRYSKYIEMLGKRMLNHDAKILPISQVASYVKEVSLDEFFIKPDTDSKEFAGLVITAANFSTWYTKMLSIGYLENHDFDVVVARNKIVDREWRIVMVNGRISDWSQYRRWRNVFPKRTNDDETNHALDYAEKIAAIWKPADVYVIDIGLTPSGYRVIEFNTFNSSGLYECEVRNIISDINYYLLEGNVVLDQWTEYLSTPIGSTLTIPNNLVFSTTNNISFATGDFTEAAQAAMESLNDE